MRRSISLALVLCFTALSLSTATESVKYAESSVRIRTPQPPYPYVARAHHAQGAGSIRVTFDDHGKAVKAEMAKSTGYSILDNNTIKWALANWTTTGGKWVRVVVPVNYRIP